MCRFATLLATKSIRQAHTPSKHKRIWFSVSCLCIALTLHHVPSQHAIFNDKVDHGGLGNPLLAILLLRIPVCHLASVFFPKEKLQNILLSKKHSEPVALVINSVFLVSFLLDLLFHQLHRVSHLTSSLTFFSIDSNMPITLEMGFRRRVA